VQGETEIENLKAQKITSNEPKNQKEVEAITRSFEKIKNRRDGRIARIPVNTIGKIIKNKGYDISKIIEYIPFLYETSLFGWSELEKLSERHKAHPNIKEYHNYINKFTDGTGEYFIRFTLAEEKVKPGKIGESIIHSTAISNIEIYKKGDHPQRIRDYLPGRNRPTAFYDLKLAEFFNSVKKDVSKTPHDKLLKICYIFTYLGEYNEKVCTIYYIDGFSCNRRFCTTEVRAGYWQQ